ncbi:unnamed protein product [Cylicocyclus nassatus]|uniref:Amino acid transporter transmembrane domain-containing protein n=1 Tax=Cylicocyclus nassatus TaxID=53992 RepID=A0AA36HCX8_CYLNA|nr:unnamed protein product [Cylicocyclus nassatus]
MVEKKIGSIYAFINLFKATLGVGAFAMPQAFKLAGFWTGLVLTVVIGFINAHGMMKIVQSAQFLVAKRLNLKSTPNGGAKVYPESTYDYIEADTGEDQPVTLRKLTLVKEDGNDENQKQIFTVESEIKKEVEEETEEVNFDYGEMAGEAFASNDSPKLRKFGKPAMIFVNVVLICLQLGLSSAFYIFVVDHAKEMVDHISGKDFNRKNMFFVVLPFFFLIASVSNVVFMSLIGLAGIVLLMVPLVILYVRMFQMSHLPIGKLTGFSNIEGFFMSCGNIIFAYIGQGVLLGIENKMKKPKQMLGLLGVISTSMFLVTLFNTATGLLGYITYGEDLKGSITLNLTNKPLDFSVKIMLMVMTYFSYNLIIFPIVDTLFPLMEKYLQDKGRGRFTIGLVHYAFRWLIAIVSFAIAIAIPNFKDIIPLIGTLTGTLLALFLPPLLHMTIPNRTHLFPTHNLFFNATAVQATSAFIRTFQAWLRLAHKKSFASKNFEEPL